MNKRAQEESGFIRSRVRGTGRHLLPLLGFGLLTLCACSSGGPGPVTVAPQVTTPIQAPSAAPLASPSQEEGANVVSDLTATGDQIPVTLAADVIEVQVSGDASAYRFSVRLSSPDTGCDRYADWWEVLSEEGELLYRRILLHSHVAEQPFSRSGGPVDIGPDTVVIVRAHLHPDGYGGMSMKGTVRDGFTEISLSTGFAPGLESEPPLPDGCAF